MFTCFRRRHVESTVFVESLSQIKYYSEGADSGRLQGDLGRPLRVHCETSGRFGQTFGRAL